MGHSPTGAEQKDMDSRSGSGMTGEIELLLCLRIQYET
jgi:hypothetical protein